MIALMPSIVAVTVIFLLHCAMGKHTKRPWMKGREHYVTDFWVWPWFEQEHIQVSVPLPLPRQQLLEAHNKEKNKSLSSEDGRSTNVSEIRSMQSHNRKSKETSKTQLIKTPKYRRSCATLVEMRTASDIQTMQDDTTESVSRHTLHTQKKTPKKIRRKKASKDEVILEKNPRAYHHRLHNDNQTTTSSTNSTAELPADDALLAVKRAKVADYHNLRSAEYRRTKIDRANDSKDSLYGVKDFDEMESVGIKGQETECTLTQPTPPRHQQPRPSAKLYEKVFGTKRPFGTMNRSIITTPVKTQKKIASAEPIVSKGKKKKLKPVKKN